MSKYPDLRTYINDKWEGVILDAAISFIKNISPSEFSSVRIPYPTTQWVEEVLVTSVYTRMTGKNVVFFVNVATMVSVKGREYGERRNDIETDSKQFYLQMVINAVFGKQFENIFVKQVTRYDDKEKFNINKSRSSSFLPYISNENIDTFATEFLSKLYPDALVTPMALPVKEIVNKLGLNVTERKLKEGIFGTIYFDDDKENGIKKGTIFYDNDLDYFGKSVGTSNTIIHECVHWFYHKPYFDLMKILNPKSNRIECSTFTSNVKKKERYVDKDYSWMEWQANSLAPRILMPTKVTLIKYDEFIHSNLVKYSGDLIKVYDETIADVADFFKVSKTSAKIRLVQLGKTDLVGFHNFVDGVKTVDYLTGKIRLDKNQTFSVNFIDAVRLSLTNEKLKNALNEKKVVYISPFFIYNDKKYITKNLSGKLILTNYAVNNMDECCLVFTINKRGGLTFDDNFYSLSFMSRSDGGDFFDNELDEFSNINGDIFSRRISPNAIVIGGEAVEDFLLKHRYDDFKTYFISLLEWSGMESFNDAELARLTKLDNKTISNYRNGKTMPLRLKQVLALCAGLNLEPEIAYDLIAKVGLSIPILDKRVDLIYKFLIQYCYDEGIDYWNEKISRIDPSAIIP